MRGKALGRDRKRSAKVIRPGEEKVNFDLFGGTVRAKAFSIIEEDDVAVVELVGEASTISEIGRAHV